VTSSVNANNVNASGYKYVAWCASLPTTDASNTDGTITTNIKYNNDLKMVAGTFTGTGANATLGHGLDTAPEFVIVKRLDSVDDWMVWHSAIANTDYMRLNLTSAAATNTTFWNSISPTATTISIGTNNAVNASGGTYVFYAFAPSQYISIGEFAGNANADGTYINTGTLADFFLCKIHTAGDAWHMYDSARDTDNPVLKRLDAGTSTAESSAAVLDFTANGVKMRTASVPNQAFDDIFISIGTPNGPTENPGR